MIVREEVIEVIQCTDDAGNTYFVSLIQEYVDTSTLAGRRETPGMRRLELPDGSKVNARGENTFQIVRNGQTIRRV